MVTKKTGAAKSKVTAPKSKTKEVTALPDQSIAALWKGLEAEGVTVHYRPVTKAEIAKAETTLKCKFPPSYVELVTTVGAPGVINPHLPPRCDPEIPWNMICAVLTPAEIAKLTRELRCGFDPDMFEDPETFPRLRRQFAQAIFFQYDSDPNNGFVFLLNTVDERGEPKVGEYVHDYLDEIDWDAGDAVLASMWEATRKAIENIKSTLNSIKAAFNSISASNDKLSRQSDSPASVPEGE